MSNKQHAQNITQRFRDLVEDSGERLNDEHYGELALLIEAGFDTAFIEDMAKIARDLETMARNIRHAAEFIDED